MICHDNLRLAEEMGVSRTYALSSRQRYLMRREWELRDELDAILSDAFRCPFRNGCDLVCVSDCMKGARSAQIWRTAGELGRVHREARVCEKLLLKPKYESGLITDDMIERARSFPVSQLVDFQRGRAQAWCHADRHPSLYLGTRNNVAVCPVCNRTFDPIHILRERDGLSFRDAVQTLISR